jgi:hypothetical protein
MSQIKMIQHYCGYLNGNQTWWPDEVKAIPNDLSEENAKQLVERGYAEYANPIENIAPESTRAAKAMDKTTRDLSGRRRGGN